MNFEKRLKKLEQQNKQILFKLNRIESSKKEKYVTYIILSILLIPLAMVIYYHLYKKDKKFENNF